jgi:hypothetical protein
MPRASARGIGTDRRRRAIMKPGSIRDVKGS